MRSARFCSTKYCSVVALPSLTSWVHFSSGILIPNALSMAKAMSRKSRLSMPRSWMASPKAQRSLLRRSVRTQHEAVEVGGKLGMAVKRKHMRDILVRPHHDHAAFVPIDAAHRKDVVAALEIGAEHLFVVAKSVTSFCREK